MKILNKADAVEDPTGKWPQAEPDNRDVEDILGAAFGLTGVVSGCAVTAQASPDMTVAVASGVAIVGGTSATVAAGNVTIGASGALPRFDLIRVSSTGVKTAVAGTGSTNPVFPDPVGQCVLAAVYVPASDAIISSTQIVDKRVIVKPWVQLSGDTMTGSLSLSSASASVNVLLTGDAQDALVRPTAHGNTSGSSPVASVLMRRVRGTVAAPLRTKSADLIGRIGATGAHAASDVAAATLLTAPSSYLEFRASEDFSSTAQGSYIRFLQTPVGTTTAAEQMRLVNFSGKPACLVLDDIQGYASDRSAKLFTQLASTNRTATITGPRGAITSQVTRYGGGTVSDSDKAVYGLAVDHASCVARTITGAANNGSGLIRITTSATHGYATGDRISIGNVGGTTEANAAWTITAIAATTFDLQGSTFVNTYTSGGSATNAGILQGVLGYVYPIATRVLSAATGTASYGDDVLAVGGFNGGTAKGSDCFYAGRNATSFPASSEWLTGMTIDCWADYGIRINGTYVNYGLDFMLGTFTLGAIRLKNASGIHARNAANSANLTLMTLNSSNELVLGTSGTAMNIVIPTSGGLRFGVANITFDATTGSKIGTATTEKFAFHNSTPIAQQTVTGSRGGNAALASLLTAMAAKGLIVDGSSA